MQRQQQQRVMFIRQRGGGFRPFAGFGDMIPIGTNVANDPDVIAATAAVNRAGTMPEMFPVNSANWNVLVNQQNLLAALLRGELTLDRFRKELNDRTLYLRAINPSNYVPPPPPPPVFVPPSPPPVNVSDDPDVVAAIAAVARAETMPEMFPVNSANWNVLVNQQNLLAALLRGELNLNSFRGELNERTLYLRAVNPSPVIVPPVIQPPIYVIPPVLPPAIHPAPPVGYHYDNNWQLVSDDPYQSPPIIAGPLPPITTTGLGMLDGTITLPVVGTVSKTTALLIAVAALLLIKN